MPGEGGNSHRQRSATCLIELAAGSFAGGREAGKRGAGHAATIDVQADRGMGAARRPEIAENEDREAKPWWPRLCRPTSRLTRAAGVHVVTVNDYWARRDAEWMGQVHRCLGLSVGLNPTGHAPSERTVRNLTAVTSNYATNSGAGLRLICATHVQTTIEEVKNRTKLQLLHHR